MYRTILAATAALFLAQAAQASDTMVKQIDVSADPGAISNAKAAAYWANLAPDLKSAIAARLVDRLGDEGSKIDIDIDEIALTNSFANVVADQDGVLAGTVHVTSDTDNSKFDSYQLGVTSKMALPFFPEGKVPVGAFHDTPEYYVAMVNAFADAVVARLK